MSIPLRVKRYFSAPQSVVTDLSFSLVFPTHSSSSSLGGPGPRPFPQPFGTGGQAYSRWPLLNESDWTQTFPVEMSKNFQTENFTNDFPVNVLGTVCAMGGLQSRTPDRAIGDKTIGDKTIAERTFAGQARPTDRRWRDAPSDDPFVLMTLLY